MNIDDKEKKYLRKLHLETQMFAEKGLFAVSSVSLPLLFQFSKHLTDKPHTWVIGTFLVLAGTCFIVTIIAQLISFRLTVQGYEELFQETTESEVSGKEKLGFAYRYKNFYFITFILGLVSVLGAIVINLFVN